MRESYGGTWLLGLIISFTFIFTAFLALSINYSRAFRVKNEVLTMIEKNGGITADAMNIIGNYLINSNYTLTGTCEGYDYGVTINGINDTRYERVNGRRRYSFCFSKVKSIAPNFPDRAFYDTNLFFRFNLPVLGYIFTFDVKGQTKDVTYPLDGKCGRNSADRIQKCKTDSE